jgi:hypothetical protein
VAPGHLRKAFKGSVLEILILPEVGSKTPRIISTKVVLPAPELPDIARCCPGEILKFILVKLNLLPGP